MSKKVTSITLNENVTFAITVCRKAFNNDNIDGDVYIDGVLSELSTFIKGYQEILMMRYRDNMTYREIGEKFDLSAERIRQIEKKIIVRMKHPSRLQNMFVSKLITKNDALKREIQESKKLHLSNMYRIKAMEKMLQEDDLARLDQEVESWSIINTPIEEMKLSHRLYNCLKKANINYVGNITELKEYNDIVSIKNLGKKCVHELLDVMDELGYEEWLAKIKGTA